ncbi:MAG: hypothetical protein WDO71_26430 [Bacteroidota bacterium]
MPDRKYSNKNNDQQSRYNYNGNKSALGCLRCERNSISARLYHPEKKLIIIATTNTTAKGSPTAHCLKPLFRRSRLASQYLINLISSSVSILTKINYRFILLHQPFKIYTLWR